MAAAVAYYLALSLFPMLLLLISGLGLVLQFTQMGQDARTQLLSILSEHCSETLRAQLEQVLDQLGSQSVVGCPFGVLTASMAAIGVFQQFDRAFDKIWRIKPQQNQGMLQMASRVVTQRLAAFMLLAGVGLSLVAILLANLALGALRSWMSHLEIPGTVFIALLDATATTIMNAFVFGALYRWLPKRRVSWSDAIRGGLLVSLIWEAGRQFLGAFLIGMRYTTAYGAIGSFIALLLWFYWGVTILLFGAEYVRVLARRHAKQGNQREPERKQPLRVWLRPRRAA
ncbi:MAG: YihY/virulence factor BrkB family protein [Planctomycetales bacterium]|nr:YihY/virulence factor BrkB family protein [Planctomycetales bacterium]